MECIGYSHCDACVSAVEICAWIFDGIPPIGRCISDTLPGRYKKYVSPGGNLFCPVENSTQIPATFIHEEKSALDYASYTLSIIFVLLLLCAAVYAYIRRQRQPPVVLNRVHQTLDEFLADQQPAARNLEDREGMAGGVLGMIEGVDEAGIDGEIIEMGELDGDILAADADNEEIVNFERVVPNEGNNENVAARRYPMRENRKKPTFYPN